MVGNARYFGERGSARFTPAVLEELIRHEPFSTTLRGSVGTHTERTADVCWEAFAAADGTRPFLPVVKTEKEINPGG